MTFWKIAKDKITTDRLLDERFHAIALHEIEGGVRRDGLWAKAVLRGGGEERRCKLAYLRLVVQHLKDEHYLSERLHEEETVSRRRATMRAASGEYRSREGEDAQTEVDAAANIASRSVALRLVAMLQERELIFEQYEILSSVVGASLSREGLLFGGYKFIDSGKKIRFKNLSELRPWFLENVVPRIERKA